MLILRATEFLLFNFGIFFQKKNEGDNLIDTLCIFPYLNSVEVNMQGYHKTYYFKICKQES